MLIFKKTHLFLTIFALISIFALAGFLSVSRASINCCYHECRSDDPPKCDGAWVQTCGYCDDDTFRDWCDSINCAAIGEFCLNGACQTVSVPCVITCATAPGCRSGLTNGNTAMGECCGSGDCYQCDSGYNWNPAAGGYCEAICDDNDNDGYGNPVSAACTHNQLDCDDTDNNINPGKPEVCDGIDNNCNGTIDENCDKDNDNYCDCGQTFAYGSDLTSTCFGTNTTDASSIANTCDCDDIISSNNPSVAEICDGIDNNCDGATDEGCICVNGTIQDCGADVGECTAGAQTCIAGSWGACAGEVGPTAEICDNKDNDCDGNTDEDLAAPLNDNQTGVCIGSHKTCSGAIGWVNDYTAAPNNEYPTETLCDGLDNNCDGTTDEGCTCINGTTQSCGTDVGECVSGTQTCTAGNWGACSDVGPTAEICDGLDNNCDGATDEDCNIDGDNYCGCGQTFTYGSDLTAICSGTNTTDAASIANTCDCNDNNINISPSAAETCDNSIDDDCDTDIDCVDADCASDPACLADCSDGTTANSCSAITGAPWYCDNTGSLVENCGSCGCAGTWVCNDPPGTACVAPTACPNSACDVVGGECSTCAADCACDNCADSGCDLQCKSFCCGNWATDTIAAEICDVADGWPANMDLNGKTCASFGYAGGDLGCRWDCKNYDPSSCIGVLGTCGNNVCDPGENCLNCPTECCPKGCADICFSLGFECGTQTLCGTPTDCGDCILPTETCNASGQCVAGCVDECSLLEFGCTGLSTEWVCGEAGDGDDCLDKVNTVCDLASGETCNAVSGKCEAASVGNTKLILKYSNKEVFLISDNDWKDVLPLVPVSIWTDPDGTIHKYPALVYHDESGAIDVDSTIHFMQLYPPSNLTAIGSIPASLTNLLSAAEPLGAGMDVTNDVDNISVADYFSYWSNYDDVVYVQDDYELALLASTYASLINAPLVIAGTANDSDGVFIGKNIICVGSPPRSCDEQYNLSQIQDKYVQVVNSVDVTNLNKIIVTNPNDLTSTVSYPDMTTDKSGDLINDFFVKNSLTSPFLASAKHELILTADDIPDDDGCRDSGQTFNCSALRDKIKQRINQLNLPDVDIGRKYYSNNIMLYDSGATKQIQDSYYGVWHFNIDNNRIVWLEQDKIEKIVAPGEYSVEDDYNLKFYDIATEQVETLYSFGANNPNEIAMHGDNIVWLEEDWNTNTFTIILFDINAKTTQTIYSTTNSIRGTGGPGLLINNNYIIWNEEIFDPITFERTYVLNEYNISTVAIIQLYSTAGRNMYINLTDNLLTWQDMDSMAGTYAMYYMKFSDHNNIAFHNPINNIDNIAVDSDIIVWQEWDFGNNNYVFHKYDVATAVITNNVVLLPSGYSPSGLAFENDKIYMYSTNSGSRNIVAYNINDNKDIQSITNPVSDVNAKNGLAINSGRIIWAEQLEKSYMFKDGYLTIIAGPNAIPYYDAPAADKQMFASIYHGNFSPDLAYGRIVGLTSSDASSYIARAIFFNDIPANDKAAFFASEPNGWIGGTSWLDNYACNIFGNSGYTVSACIRQYGIDNYSSDGSEPVCYEDADFIYYYDHGSATWAGINYTALPYMKNVFINTLACSTADIAMAKHNFALTAMRKGAIAYLGAVQTATTYDTVTIANSVYYENIPIGFAFAKYAFTTHESTLLGDPTLVIGRTLVNQPLLP